MGYLDNSIITIDAILTTKGRELLAKNNGSFIITQFAVADDEIDYTLYNPNHPSGSSFYGEAIETMPLLEAFPQENQVMKYKLVTLPRGTAKLPIIDLGYTTINLKQGNSLAITPQTLNYLGGNLNEDSGYSATVSDIRLLNTFEGIGQQQTTVPQSNETFGTNVSKTVVGNTINIRATTLNTIFGTNTSLYTTLTVIGRDSGARITIPLIINKI